MSEVTLLGLVSCLGGKTQVSIKTPKKVKRANKTQTKTAQDWYVELSDNDARADYIVTKIDVVGYGYIEVEIYE